MLYWNQSTNSQLVFHPENKQSKEMLRVNMKLFEFVAYLSAHVLVLGVGQPVRLFLPEKMLKCVSVDKAENPKNLTSCSCEIEVLLLNCCVLEVQIQGKLSDCYFTN